VLAASGEESLDLLQRELVDVIFMDHTMPGMDGLEVVAAIKRNPRTALIPVMMYTTKEGEVFVGQARALGAIGVLPKEVHPQVLFDVLVSLGLVSDRRDPAMEGEIYTGPRRRSTDLPGPRPLGAPAAMALEPLVLRILNDQDALREELRVSQHELKTKIAAVAEATVAQQRHTPLREPESSRLVAMPSTTLWKVAAGVLGALAIVFATLLSQSRGERIASNDGAIPAADAAVLAASNVASDLKTALRSAEVRSDKQFRTLLDTLTWALNQNSTVRFDEVPFNDARAATLRELLSQLVVVGFHGRVRIESHLGEFCLSTDETGELRLADPDAPIEACDRMGHPLDESTDVADRQSMGFADFVESSPLLSASGIRLELVAHDRASSLRRHPFPNDVVRAGDWNRIAETNNRLEYATIIEERE
jgi:CheY-like chemotaxis protein